MLSGTQQHVDGVIIQSAGNLAARITGMKRLQWAYRTLTGTTLMLLKGDPSISLVLMTV